MTFRYTAHGRLFGYKKLERREALPGFSEIPPMRGNLVSAVQRADKLDFMLLAKNRKRVHGRSTAHNDHVRYKTKPFEKRSCLLSFSGRTINGH